MYHGYSCSANQPESGPAGSGWWGAEPHCRGGSWGDVASPWPVGGSAWAEGSTWPANGETAADGPENFAASSSSKKEKEKKKKKAEKSEPETATVKSNMDILKELRLLGISSERGYKTSDIVAAISQCNGSTPMAVKILWAKDKEERKHAQGAADDWVKSLGKPKSTQKFSEFGDKSEAPGSFSRSGSDGAEKKAKRKGGISWRRRKGNFGEDEAQEEDDDERQQAADEVPDRPSVFTPGVGLHSQEQMESMTESASVRDGRSSRSPSRWKFFRRRSSQEGQQPDNEEH